MLNEQPNYPSEHVSIHFCQCYPFLSQTSLDVPAKLKKELDAVLALQADLASSDRVVQLARATIEKGNASPGILEALTSLECSHMRLMTKAKALYSSLNVHKQFPELTNVSLDFMQILLMAQDLKINIRKRAVGSFLEWDKLDRAVGGKDKPLGMSITILRIHHPRDH